jgi:hypothetical protein
MIQREREKERKREILLLCPIAHKLTNFSIFTLIEREREREREREVREREHIHTLSIFKQLFIFQANSYSPQCNDVPAP